MSQKTKNTQKQKRSYFSLFNKKNDSYSQPEIELQDFNFSATKRKAAENEKNSTLEKAIRDSSVLTSFLLCTKSYNFAEMANNPEGSVYTAGHLVPTGAGDLIEEVDLMHRPIIPHSYVINTISGTQASPDLDPKDVPKDAVEILEVADVSVTVKLADSTTSYYVRPIKIENSDVMAQLYVPIDPNNLEIRLVVAGTYNLKTLLDSDTQIAPGEIDFEKGRDALIQGVNNAIKETKERYLKHNGVDTLPQGIKLVTEGHSLGGAVAQRTVAELLKILSVKGIERIDSGEALPNVLHAGHDHHLKNAVQEIKDHYNLETHAPEATQFIDAENIASLDVITWGSPGTTAVAADFTNLAAPIVKGLGINMSYKQFKRAGDPVQKGGQKFIFSDASEYVNVEIIKYVKGTFEGLKKKIGIVTLAGLTLITAGTGLLAALACSAATGLVLFGNDIGISHFLKNYSGIFTDPFDPSCFSHLSNQRSFKEKMKLREKLLCGSSKTVNGLTGIFNKKARPLHFKQHGNEQQQFSDHTPKIRF